MNRAKAIQKYCIECAGDSAKEVTMCHIIDCPLWQFRTGNGIKSKVYKKRIALSRTKYPDDWQEIDALVVGKQEFARKNMPILQSTSKDRVKNASV